MVKKGCCFGSIKNVFTPHSKQKLANESERKNEKRFKKHRRHGETNSSQAASSKPPSLREASLRADYVPRVATPKLPSPRADEPRLDSPRVTTPKLPSPRLVSPMAVQKQENVYRPETMLLVQHASATKIQRSFRGYMARKSVKALKGLVRLQGVVRGHRVKLQTISALKYMQQMVSIQSQIQSHRIKMLESQAQDQQYPLGSPVQGYGQPLRDFRLTPSRLCLSPLSQSIKQHHFKLDNHSDTHLPESSRSTPLTLSRPIHSSSSRYSRGRLRGENSSFKDDDSFTSCPSLPNYMSPTVSSKAKVRPSSYPRKRVMGTPVSETRRMSYPPEQQSLEMFRWKKGSLLMSHKGPGSPQSVVLEKQKTVKSVGTISIDSTASMPATVGRKEFNRFV